MSTSQSLNDPLNSVLAGRPHCQNDVSISYTVVHFFVLGRPNFGYGVSIPSLKRWYASLFLCLGGPFFLTRRVGRSRVSSGALRWGSGGARVVVLHQNKVALPPSRAILRTDPIYEPTRLIIYLQQVTDCFSCFGSRSLLARRDGFLFFFIP